MPSKFKAQLVKTLRDLNRAQFLERIPDDKLTRHTELHPSSFPFCPLKTLVPVAEHGLFLERWESPQSDYYCSVGTAVHTVFQRHFGRNCHVVGDWTCLKCRNVVPFSTFEQAGLCCGRKRHYEELGIKFRKTIRGHTDGLFFFDGHYWVIDYKTSSVKKTTKYNEDGEGLPLVSNREQIRSYVVLLEREYKISIRGWALIYLARDNPFTNHAVCTEVFTDELREETRKKMVLYDRQYDRMLDVDNKHQHLDFLIETKPCKTLQDYKDLFGSAYQECPLVDVCFDELKLIRHLGKLVKNSPHLPMRTSKRQDKLPPSNKKEWKPSGEYKPPKITEF